MFWKSKPKERTINEPAFRVTLPDEWIQEPSTAPNLWTYHAEGQREELTISIMGDTQQMSHDELSAWLHRLVEMRRHAETQIPGVAGVMVSEATFAELEGTLVARYVGTQPSAQRRFYCLVLGSSRTLYFFYYEALDMPETESEARARQIFNSIVVPR